MRRAIIVILDGLRRDCVDDEHTPNLMRFASERAATFANHRSVFPSATRVVSASLATGCHPGRHELQGNSLALIEDGHLVRHDAGHPDFLQHKRRVTGRSLAVPTLAERVRDAGGAIVLYKRLARRDLCARSRRAWLRLSPRRLFRSRSHAGAGIRPSGNRP